MLQVPDTETLSILDTYFSMDISPGSYAREDINDTVYIFNKFNNIEAIIPTDVIFHLMEENNAEEDQIKSGAV